MGNRHQQDIQPARRGVSPHNRSHRLAAQKHQQAAHKHRLTTGNHQLSDCNHLNRGQAAVETALVLPLLAAVILMLVQVGLLVRDHILVVHAAREAGRAAAITPSTKAATTAAATASALDANRLTVTTSGGRATGQHLRVEVSYKPKTTVPVVGRFFPNITITEALTVRVE
ncbi:MAG: pilus assembly protein [bacterium]|nr:pilus assembly protein [bacterium]